MTADLVALVAANAIYAAIGASLLVATGVVDRRRTTWHRLGAAYLLGVAIVVIPATYLAVAGIAVGWTAIGAIAAISLGIAARTLWRAKASTAASPSPRRLSWANSSSIATLVLFALATTLLVAGIRAFAVKPLSEWDGWAVWALKGRVLYSAPADAPDLLTSASYGPPSYPIALPELEALGSRAIGAFDGALVDVQLGLLAFGLLGVMWAFLRTRAPAPLIAVTALGIVAAPQFLYQLGTNYADIPLAIFVAAALLAAAYWLSLDVAEWWVLPCFALFAGMSGLLKNEGLLFSLAAVVSLCIVTAAATGRSLRPVLIAAAGVGALVAPWRAYASVRDLTTYDYDLSNAVNPFYLADHANRVWPVVTELASELANVDRWGLLVPAIGMALVAALIAPRRAVGLFASIWLALALAGLVLTYWISVLPLGSDLFNSSYRTIAAPIIGSAALLPLLVAPALERGLAAVRARVR